MRMRRGIFLQENPAKGRVVPWVSQTLSNALFVAEASVEPFADIVSNYASDY